MVGVDCPVLDFLEVRRQERHRCRVGKPLTVFTLGLCNRQCQTHLRHGGKTVDVLRLYLDQCIELLHIQQPPAVSRTQQQKADSSTCIQTKIQSGGVDLMLRQPQPALQPSNDCMATPDLVGRIINRVDRIRLTLDSQSNTRQRTLRNILLDTSCNLSQCVSQQVSRQACLKRADLLYCHTCQWSPPQKPVPEI